jgi:hypothetical protein
MGGPTWGPCGQDIFAKVDAAQTPRSKAKRIIQVAVAAGVPSGGLAGQISAPTESTMYERFTDRARKVMQLANQEAQRFNHEYIGTEHVLLGLIKEGSGVAANVLKNLDVDLRKIRL